mgnify:CR=1 FL=1
MANILLDAPVLQERNAPHNTAREIHAHLHVAFLRNLVVIQIVVFVHKTLIALQIIVLLVRQCQLAFHLQTLLEVTVLIVLIVH